MGIVSRPRIFDAWWCARTKLGLLGCSDGGKGAGAQEYLEMLKAGRRLECRVYCLGTRYEVRNWGIGEGPGGWWLDAVTCITPCKDMQMWGAAAPHCTPELQRSDEGYRSIICCPTIIQPVYNPRSLPYPTAQIVSTLQT